MINEESNQGTTNASASTQQHLSLKDQEESDSRSRKRSRSPRNNVFTKIRSYSLGRSISSLRVRHRNRGGSNKERPVSGDPRLISTSSNDEAPNAVSEAKPASPMRGKRFAKSANANASSEVSTGQKMLRTVRQQIRNLRPRSKSSNAPNPPTQTNEAVVEWLGQSTEMLKCDDKEETQAENADEEKEGTKTEELESEDVPVLVELAKKVTDPDLDEVSYSETTEATEDKRTVEASTEVADDESEWQDADELAEMLNKGPVKGKDPHFSRAIQVWEISIHLISGSQLVIRDSTGTSDPYVKFKYNGKLLEKSKIIRRSLNPIWDEHFCFYIDDNKKPIELRVYDHDKLSDDYMGHALIDLSTLEMDSNTELTLELEDETGKSKEKFMGTLRLSCKISTLLFDPDNASTSSTRGTSPGRTGGRATRGMKSRDKRMSQAASSSSRSRYRRIIIRENNVIQIQKGIKSAIDTSRSRFKQTNWIATVTITLIEGKHLLPMDSNGLSDPFVKFRLGSEKFRSKVLKSTLNPRWLEQFDLRLSDEVVEGGASRILHITVWDHDDIGRNDFMGRTSVDLASLRREHTHLVEQDLEDGAGLLRLLVTISGTYEPDSVTDLRNYSVSEVDRQRLVAKFNMWSTFSNMRDVGWLQVKVLKAEGLVSSGWSARCDPFCVVELVNSRLQTHTEYKTCDPEWNKVFVFNVRDIHSALEVTIFHEDRDKKAELVGTVLIPLLKIRNGEKRWYALKDRKLMRRVKGAVLLEMDLIYNQIRAAWRTINPKETKYALPNPKFKIAIMRRHIDRCGRIIDSFILFSQFVESCWSWESPSRSILAFLSFMVIVWSFEPYMLPLTLVIVFSKEYIYNTLLSLVYRKARADDLRREEMNQATPKDTNIPSFSMTAACASMEDDCVYASSTDDDDDKSDKEDRRTLKERIQVVQDTMLNVQEQMGSIASFCERIHNSFVWTVPWLSRFAVIALIVATILLYLVPLRWLIMAWGINKFTKKLIRPNFIDNNELLDFISRVPSDLQLIKSKEMKPDLSMASEAKKR